MSLGCLVNVGLTNSRESQQPEDTVWHSLEDVEPHGKGSRINLVELVEVTVDNGIIG